MKNIVTNIQRFCLQDGPGIRTTVFLKGCNLSCPWCSNPENISFDIEKSKDGTIIFGKEYTCEELYNEVIRDELYFENFGGVTLSGGEPLWHVFDLKSFLIKLKEENISIAVETALNVPIEYLKEACKYVDFFLVDIKILDEEKCSKINLNLNLYINNVKYLLNNKSCIKFRMPLVENYTYTVENLTKVKKFLDSNNIKELDIFEVHELGRKKYELLGKKTNHFNPIDYQIINKIFKNTKINILKI